VTVLHCFGDVWVVVHAVSTKTTTAICRRITIRFMVISASNRNRSQPGRGCPHHTETVARVAPEVTEETEDASGLRSLGCLRWHADTIRTPTCRKAAATWPALFFAFRFLRGAGIDLER
jgi:hypothetical protein